MAQVLLFAALREAARTGRVEIHGDTVADVLTEASETFGDEFTRLLPYCRVMVGLEPATASDAVGRDDELAILPPVSGG